MDKQTVIIGDIHGCIDEFKELIDLINKKCFNPRIILLGDLIDRGPDSVGVVRLARELNLESVKGNHDHKFLKWWKSSGSRADVYDGKPYYRDFSDADISYLARMENYIKIDNHIIVHAGLRPGVSLSNQSIDDLFYIRYLDDNDSFVSLKKINKAGSKEAAKCHFWTRDWKGPESIIYGHHVHDFNNPLIEEVKSGIFCYGIDNGCVFGGNLTAMVLETKEILQVKAKRVYYQSTFEVR